MALQELKTSIFDGEFGSHPKLSLAHLPDPVPTYGLGRFPLRAYISHIDNLPHTIADLWTPRDLARAWFTARRLNLPPWLARSAAVTIDGIAEPGRVSVPALTDATSRSKPSFDHMSAKSMYAGLKVNGQNRPSDSEALVFLRNNFATVSREQARRVVTEIWGRGKTGPRNPRN
jgi:hypothetical protein